MRLRCSQEWEASEEHVERRRLEHLDKLLGPAERGSEVLLSYDEFEAIVKAIRKRAGIDTHEEHLEMLMDMFDAALQETEKVLAKESDAVHILALKTVLGRYGLIPLLEPSAFVDPLQVNWAMHEIL